MMILSCAPLMALICAPGPSQEVVQEPSWVRPGVFEFHVAPGPELYYEVRSLAALQDATKEEEIQNMIQAVSLI